MAIYYFLNEAGLLGEYSEIKIWGYQKPDNFPFHDPFMEDVFKSTEKWLTSFSYFPSEARLSQAYDITLRIDTTSHVIATNHLIRDYIEAMIFAFKQPYIGLPCYLTVVRHMIQSAQNLPDEQKESLTHYIDSHKESNDHWLMYSNFVLFDKTTLTRIGSDHTPENAENILIMESSNDDDTEGYLIGIYRKWLKIFPFELDCFSQNKQYFLQRFSDFVARHNQERTNHYLGITFRIAKTQEEFLTFLFQTTTEMLQSVQSTHWIQTASRSEVNTRQLSLMNQLHQLKQEKLLTSFHKGEKAYIKVLKEWLKNEQQYFDQVHPYLSETIQTEKAATHTVPIIEYFPMLLVGKLQDYCHGQQFALSSTDLYQLLNSPEQYHKPAKVKKGEIARMEYLMAHINDYLEMKTAPHELFTSICQNFGLNPRNCYKRKNLPEDYRQHNKNYMQQVRMILSSGMD